MMIVLFIVLNLWLTALMLLITANVMGKYNIGGVPNKTGHKILAVVGWLILYFLWAWALGFVDINFTLRGVKS